MVGNDNETIVGRNAKVYGIFSSGRHLVDESQFPVCRVNREGADFTTVSVHRIERLPLSVKGKKRRILKIFHQLDQRPFNAAWHKPVDAQPFAARISFFRCPATDVSKESEAFRFHEILSCSDVGLL